MAEHTDKTARTSIVVIGAGWYGIVAAKTYLQFDPTIDLTVIDADDGVGGVWGPSRIYPGLIADSPAGLFEFSDLKMSEELENVEEWADITGKDVQQYLEQYARRFGIRERCRFRTTVTRIAREGSKWAVYVKTDDDDGDGDGSGDVLLCDKLIVATGITSRPRIPNIPRSEFIGTVLHSKELGRMRSFLTSADVNNVVVVGGNKSAVEAVTMCATAGKTVTWLMRRDGNGPGILFSTRSNGRHRAAAGASRWSSIFRPGLYAPRPWIHRFLYSGNWLGIWLCSYFWKAMTKKMLASHQSTHPKRKLLNPETSDFFWPKGGVSFMHGTEEELMKLVEDGRLVHILRESIATLRERSAHLSNGQAVPADAVIFATGWESTQTPLFDTGLAAEVGLPISISDEDNAQREYWRKLHSVAQEDVFSMYPALRNPPRQAPSRTTTPYRLFRTIASPSLAARGDHSLAFVGLISNTQVASHAEITALWAVSYLTGKLYEAPVGKQLSSRTELDTDIAKMNTFMEKRYLGRKQVPDAAMEIQDYTDLMMRDMGLRPDRKRLRAPASLFGWKAFKAEYFTPYMPRDYIGVVVEFLTKYTP